RSRVGRHKIGNGRFLDRNGKIIIDVDHPVPPLVPDLSGRLPYGSPSRLKDVDPALAGLGIWNSRKSDHVRLIVIVDIRYDRVFDPSNGTRIEGGQIDRGDRIAIED